MIGCEERRMKSTNNNDWLGFSLSPQINMEVVSSESDHHTHHQSNLNTSCLFYGGGDQAELYSQLSLMPTKSDGSLCIMEALNRSQNQGIVPCPSSKLEDFLGGPNINGAHNEYENNDKGATTMYYYQQQLLPFRNQPYFQPLQDEMYHNIYNEIEGASINGGMGYGALHSLSLSMRPGSQTSTVTAPASINMPSVGGGNINDCVMALDVAKKRGRGKMGQKQPVHRKSIDTFGQRTSQYRGVTRHRWTGRYEAHLWDNSCKKDGQTRKGRQVYLGGYDMEDKAARAYDLAALKYWGPSTHINFPLENYQEELKEMKNMSRQEYVAHLRRNSSGFSRGASIYRGVTRHHQHGRWQARIGRVAGNKDLYLGTFNTQEDAAEAYDVAAIKFRGASAVTNFDITRYDVQKIMASTTLLSGENARRTKAVSTQNTDREINLTEDNNNAVLFESPNQTIDHNQQVSVAFNGLIGIDESRKMASTHISNSSSLVTSLNSSSEESPESKFSITTSPISSWMPTNQIRPFISLTHVPLFAAWSDI